MITFPQGTALLRQIRRTVEAQGYDSFREDIVAQRAGEVLDEFLDAESEARKKRTALVSGFTTLV